MSFAVYSWSIPEEWKRESLDSKTKAKAQEKLKYLEALVSVTLLANPDKGLTIERALQDRHLQKKQIRELTEILAKPVDENAALNSENHFFEGKVRHQSQKITHLYLKIIELSAEKPAYMQTLIARLLKAYETFVSSRKDSVADNAYTAQKETEFFERILTVMLSKKFDTEFAYIQTGLTKSQNHKYNITASKIMNNINNGIDGPTIDRLLQREYTPQEIETLIEVTYPKLLKTL